MPISAPEVTVESIIKSGFADIIANRATYLPLVFSNFPSDYAAEAANYLSGANFKVYTAFGYAYDASQMPVFNIVLSNESEGTWSDKQMYLGDIVDPADQNPNTEDYEESGSMWSCSISVIIRAEKPRQVLILYALLKWLMLKNRETLESMGIIATKFSGTDLMYDNSKQPAFSFFRTWKMDCKTMNTWETDITSDPVIDDVVSAIGEQVRVLPQSVI